MKIRILHILNTGSYSGAENVVITIIQNTANNLDNIYLSLNGSIRDILNEKKIRFYAVEKLSVHNIRKAIRELKPDIIHAHDFTAGIIASLSTSKIPIINHLHNNSPWIKEVGINSIAYGLSCLRYRKILTVSDSVMNEFVFGYWFKKKSIVVGNPIDVRTIYSKIENIELTEFPESDVLFLGRLSDQKNPIFFRDYC